MECLRQIGLPQELLQAISCLYSNNEHILKLKGQRFPSFTARGGVRQGCPLSPFGMVMTVLMEDARGMMSDEAKAACTKGELEEILFADDTLLMSGNGSHLEEYMAAVEKCGADYGLQVHWGKVHLVPVGTTQRVRGPSGQPIPP